jgi:hypothetical protein
VDLADPNDVLIAENRIEQIQHRREYVTEQLAGGPGTKVGTAYKLETGEIIYMAETNQTSGT